jgi:hypothetical protein
MITRRNLMVMSLRDGSIFVVGLARIGEGLLDPPP